MKLYDRREERTGVQEARDWDPRYDVQCDFVMVYGFHNLKERIAHYKRRGYVVHLMTGVSWGEYQDYLFGKFDGRKHFEEGQTRRDGSDISHGKFVPYMVPSISFSHYLAENLKKAVDYGVEAIHLEEPEFWVNAGYSEAFKREWKLYYKEDWKDPEASAEGQYMASRLKQYLYTRTLDRLCAELKEYALVRYNRVLRFYVPTHSLINYTQWRIVSPESALIDLPTIDGYIAQIWTGTSREKNTYRGVTKERTFETAFLEYGVMQELVRGTGRKMWFLQDPIEDNPRYTWADYRQNYYKTVVAALFHPDVAAYEVCPWPARVFAGKYPKEDGSGREEMPDAYKTNLVTVMHTLREMANEEASFREATDEIGILLADSAMFQRHYPDSSPEEAENRTVTFSAFYGIALPLLKKGIFARPVQLDNVRRFASYLDRYHTLVLSYEFMKPTSPDINTALATWVRNGGRLIYVGDGSDSFHKIRGFWNREGLSFENPAEHLFSELGLDRRLDEGIYPVKDGSFTYLCRHPKALAETPAEADGYLAAVEHALGTLHTRETLVMDRGHYTVAALLDEGESESYTLSGRYVDLFSHTLDTVTDPVLKAGDVKLYYNLQTLDTTLPCDILAIAGRVERLRQSTRMLAYTVKGPEPMICAARIYTKRPVKGVTATVGKQPLPVSFTYDPSTKTTLVTHPSSTRGVKVKVTF